MEVSKKDVRTVLRWAYRLERELESRGYFITNFYTPAVERAHSRILEALRKGS